MLVSIFERFQFFSRIRFIISIKQIADKFAVSHPQYLKFCSIMTESDEAQIQMKKARISAPEEMAVDNSEFSIKSSFAKAKWKQKRRPKRKSNVAITETAANKSLFQELPFAVEPSFSLSTSSFTSETTKQVETQPVKEKSRVPRQPPNYFVGIPILSEEIRSGIEAVQQEILSHEPRLKPALIDLRTLHITLIVIRLDEIHCLHDAKIAMDRSITKIREANLTNLNLEFEGCDHFNESVVFVQMKDNSEKEKLSRIAQIMKDSFGEIGIIHPSNDAAFKAHLTLAKLSKDFFTMKKVKKIKTAFFANSASKHFGSEGVKNLQLLSMLKPKTESGYYYCPCELPFDLQEPSDSPIDVDDV